MPDFDFLGGEIVHYPLSNGVDEVSEQFFFAQTGFNSVLDSSNPGVFLTSQKWDVVVVVVFRQNTISYHLPDLSDLGIELRLLTSNTFSFL